jgi:AbiEi antitoxin C-terminal domain
MGEPFIGSEALRAGRLTRHRLRMGHVAVYPDVYVPAATTLTAAEKAKAAWLWTGREAIVAGRSAAALHGARWIDAGRPAEVLWDNRRPPRGVRVWSDRVAEDETHIIRGMRVTTPERTALDIACRYPRIPAVAAIDALARATRMKTADVELLADRYRGRRGIRGARTTLNLVDAGAESPQETYLRLMVIDNGFPTPQTQIPVWDCGALVAELDMGWEHMMIALDYEGDHHRRTREAFTKGIRRHDAVTELGWTDIRVTARDTDGGIVARLTAAWRQRLCALGENPDSGPPWRHVRRPNTGR